MNCFKIPLLLLAVPHVAACGKVNVHHVDNDTKRIELSEVGRISFPPQASYAHPESQMVMSTTAMKECPDGYTKIKEEYVPDRGDGRDMMVWEIRCLTGGQEK